MKKSEKQKNIYLKELKKMNEKYDPEENMIKASHSEDYNYHTSLRGGYVHPTRKSLDYALNLLGTDKNKYIQRANEIIKKVISLQDTDPESETYGIWPYYAEEPLPEMTNPDWNWADFCGKKLLQIIIEYGDIFSQSVFNDIKNSIIDAAKSIIRRDVGPHYTNIAIMGAYVTISSGELFNENQIFDYGKKRLKKFYDHTKYHGAFNEYNSPTYTLVALKELSRMLSHIQDKKCLNWIQGLHDMTWKSIARHFHTKTGLWAGPHSRCYNTLSKKHWPIIQKATDNKIKFISSKKLEKATCFQKEKLHCPDNYLNYFKRIDNERYFRKTFYKDTEEKKSKIATTYMTSDFTLGSFSQSDLWNQRRAVIAYWGDRQKQSYLHLRCLHDNYDFSSAIIHSIQNKGNILSVINFATDGGDKHIHLDKIKNGTIKARDIRIRIELAGLIDDLEISELSKKWKIEHSFNYNFDNFDLNIKVPYCEFDNNKIEYELQKEDNKFYLDIILFNDKQKKINLSSITKAICLVIIDFNSKTDKKNKYSISIKNTNNNKFTGVWNCNQSKYNVNVINKPVNIDNIFKKSELSII